MIGYIPLPQRRQAPVMVTAFGGLDRNPDAVLGAWASDLNLSTERAPRMRVRKNRVPVDGIDGNEIDCGVIAACGELDRIALLDEFGNLWSGGNSLPLLSGEKSVRTDQGARITIDDPAAALTYFGGAVGKHTLVYRIDIGAEYWEDEDEPHTYPVNKNLSNIGMHWSEAWEATARIPAGTKIAVTICYTDRQMIAMGANVIIFPDKVWANAVKLASGQAMVSGTDYGSLDAAFEVEEPATSGSTTIFALRVCNADGVPYSPTAAASAPSAPDNGDEWLDTTNHTLKKYDEAKDEWIAYPATFVSISYTGIGVGFRDGDGVELGGNTTTSPIYVNGSVDASGRESVMRLFNALPTYGKPVSHVLEKATDNMIVIPGIIDYAECELRLQSDSEISATAKITLTRTMPEMDYVVESGNRLWGCRYGLDEASGEVVNEIYASALGSFTNWRRYDNLSVSSYAASRGTDGAFTGAAVLDGNPLFFRAGSVEKVFPSASGAHQIRTQTLDGVEPGSDKSLCIVDNVLYYKSRRGVMAYTGTLPRLVSGALGSERYSSGVFGRDGKRLYCSMLPEQGDREIYVYDTERGEWHREDGAPELSMVVWREQLYMLISGQLVRASGGADSRGVRWEAETPEIGLDMIERKRVSHIQLFCELERGATASVFVSYDGGNWNRKGWVSGNRMGTQTVEVFPRRCERLRMKLEGIGGFELVRLAYRVEEGGDRP